MAIQKKSVINKPVAAKQAPAEGTQSVSENKELKASSLTALSMAKRRAIKAGAAPFEMRTLKTHSGRRFTLRTLKKKK